MTAFAFSEEYPFFSDTNGAALDSGYVYIGTASLDPRTNPITVYWDKDLTIPAAQPLRTSAGSIVRSGIRSTVYIDATSYSVLVTNRNGVTVVNKPVMGGDAASDLSQSITLDVGTGGDFLTINAALAWLSPRRRTFGNDAVATINLLAGFTMAEQVLLNDGMDLGWITIVAEDSAVPIDTGFITETIDTEDGIIPVFGAVRNSILPIIGAKFEYPVNSTANDGVAVLFNSQVTFLPGAGVVKARNGLKVLYGSHASCYMPGLTIGGGGTGAGTVTGVDFTYAYKRALHVAYGSRAGLARSMLHHSEGDYCVYVIWGSEVELYQSNMSYSTGEAVLCRDGSLANCRDTNVSYSLVGYHAIHGGIINARSREPGDPGYSVWVGDGAKGCGTYAVLATNASVIEAPDLICDDNLSGRAVSAGQGSIVNISGGSVKNAAGTAVYATEGATVNATDVDVSGAGINGFQADEGATINASGADASNAGEYGVWATGATNVDFGPSAVGASTATGCGTMGILAENGANVNARGATLNNNPTGVEARQTGSINMRSGSATGCTSYAVSVIEGGTVTCNEATLTGAGTYGIYCRAGTVTANGADCSTAGTTGVRIEVGGIVRFNSGTGTLSTAANAITSSGIIFQ